MTPIFIYVITATEEYVVGDLFTDPPEGSVLLASIDPKEWFESYLNASLKEREEMLRGITL
jgi:hypothetical protein